MIEAHDAKNLAGFADVRKSALSPMYGETHLLVRPTGAPAQLLTCWNGRHLARLEFDPGEDFGLEVGRWVLPVEWTKGFAKDPNQIELAKVEAVPCANTAQHFTMLDIEHEIDDGGEFFDRNVSHAWTHPTEDLALFARLRDAKNNHGMVNFRRIDTTRYLWTCTHTAVSGISTIGRP